MGRARVVGACCSVVAASVMIAACGSSGSSSSTGTGSGSEGTTKVGVALFGPKNDNSFNQAAFAGVTQAAKQDPNLKVTGVLENKSTNQQASDAIQTLGPANKVVVGVSRDFRTRLRSVAPKYPNTYFLDIAGYTTKLHKNVTGFANDWGAPSYVGGVIAANMTKSNVVGYVGGAEIPPTTQAAAGFAAGAKSVKPNIKVLSNIVGDFNDVAKAKAATTAMLTDGADVVFPFLDAGIAGAYAAGKASGKNPAMFKLIVPDCQAYSNMASTEYVNNTLATATMLAQHARGR